MHIIWITDIVKVRKKQSLIGILLLIVKFYNYHCYLEIQIQKGKNINYITTLSLLYYYVFLLFGLFFRLRYVTMKCFIDNKNLANIYESDNKSSFIKLKKLFVWSDIWFGKTFVTWKTTFKKIVKRIDHIGIQKNTTVFEFFCL